MCRGGGEVGPVSCSTAHDIMKVEYTKRRDHSVFGMHNPIATSSKICWQAREHQPTIVFGVPKRDRMD